MKKFNSYCVRFTLLNHDDIYLELSLYSYDTETAVETARFILSKSLEIHPDRLCLDIAYLEV